MCRRQCWKHKEILAVCASVSTAECGVIKLLIMENFFSWAQQMSDKTCLRAQGQISVLGGHLVPSCQMGSLTQISLKVFLGGERSTPSEAFLILPWCPNIDVWCKSPRIWSLFSRRAALGEQCTLGGWRTYDLCRAIACVLAREVSDSDWSNCDSCLSGAGIVKELKGAFSARGENREESDQFRGGW